ncbi:MAG: hypothetical protein ACPGID_06190 [Rubricella sp.]
MRWKIAPLFAGYALLGLAACGSISPAGMVAAGRLDPLGTPPDRIGVAVGVPETVRLGPGDAVMQIAFRGGTPASTVVIEEEVPLQLARDASRVIRPNSAGEIVYLATLLPEDAAAFAEAQAAIREARERGIDGSGTLGLRVIGGCYTGPRPDGLPTSSWLRTDPSGSFVPLTQRVDAFEAMGDASAFGVAGILTPCQEP